MPNRQIEPFVPAITKFTSTGEIDLPRFVAHAKRLLDAGYRHVRPPFRPTSDLHEAAIAEAVRLARAQPLS